jgi:hypothetical protein
MSIQRPHGPLPWEALNPGLLLQDQGSNITTQVEVLKAYSHPSSLLYDLRTTWQIVTNQDSSDDYPVLGSQASDSESPQRWSKADRLAAADVQAIIDLYTGGVAGPDLAAKFGISLSSVRRLLREHGVRRYGRGGASRTDDWPTRLQSPKTAVMERSRARTG